MKLRDNSIDFMKGLLVMLMILGHTIQFFPGDHFSSYLSLYVNLTTFSGFMFTFGYVCYKAYILKPSDILLLKRLLYGAAKTLLAFYLSGISYNIIVENEISTASIINVLILKDIPSFSECLFCFVFAYPLIFVWSRFNKHLNVYVFIIAAVISLLLTKINYEAVTIPALGAMIGTKSFACFPIIQYSSLFIGGMYLASKNKVFDWWILFVSLGGLGLYTAYIIIVHDIPVRFPPSLPWIVGSYFFVYVYYLISKRFASKENFLSTIGRHSLVFLVISNIIIFSLYRFCLTFYLELPMFARRITHISITIICLIVSLIYVKLIKKEAE